jgi:hypothetical protein
MSEDIPAQDAGAENLLFKATCAQLKERCAAANLHYRERQWIGDTVVDIELPCGAERRQLTLSNEDAVTQLLRISFEDYIFLGDYEAIFCQKGGFIEATIAQHDLDDMLDEGLHQLSYSEVKSWRTEGKPLICSWARKGSSTSEKVSIGPISDELSLLNRLASQYFHSTSEVSLRIDHVRASNYDQAMDLLERLSFAFFFQIDRTREFPIVLSRRRIFRFRPRAAKGDLVELEFPRTEYDKAPMALYWYARTAREMPLQQYLAYYQAIEFYFPAYSQAQAKRLISQILKDPGFRMDRDADIGRILTAVRPAARGFGDERSQLRAVIQECIDPEGLRNFLDANERRNFFSEKTAGVSEVIIPILNPTADLRNEAAERIYDIRCKIVHTKSGARPSEPELILPFSREEQLLYQDIELIQYVARQVLIAASTPFR